MLPSSQNHQITLTARLWSTQSAGPEDRPGCQCRCYEALGQLLSLSGLLVSLIPQVFMEHNSGPVPVLGSGDIREPEQHALVSGGGWQLYKSNAATPHDG